MRGPPIGLRQIVTLRRSLFLRSQTVFSPQQLPLPFLSARAIAPTRTTHLRRLATMAAAQVTAMPPVSATGWTPPEPGTIPAPARRAPQDIHTHAHLGEIRPTHLDLDWTIDWDRRIFSGSVEHTLVVEQDAVDRCVMDSSFLDIHSVKVDGEEAKWDLSKRINTLGSALTMQIGKRSQGDKIKVRIEYSTTEQCTALGWLTAE